MDWQKQLKAIQEESGFLLSESKIRAWLKHIEETDSDVIEEIVERCKVNPEARRYFLMRSEETPRPIRHRGEQSYTATPQKASFLYVSRK